MTIKNEKPKEQRSIIVRTRKNNTVGTYLFVTVNRNKDLPTACSKFQSYTRIAECIDVDWNMGGDVIVHLYNSHPNGFMAEEIVVFRKEVVTGIEIETDFEELR